MTQEERINKVREARDFLHNQGYYVTNLWMLDDVLELELDDAGTKPNITEDQARWVLKKSLSNEWITEQIFTSIREHIELALLDKEVEEDYHKNVINK